MWHSRPSAVISRLGGSKHDVALPCQSVNCATTRVMKAKLYYPE